MEKDTCGHIYLVHKREFKATNTPIYKVGRSQSIHQRLRNYTKCTVIQVWYVDDVFAAETDILKVMRNTFPARQDIGNEYFEGNPYKMIDVINDRIKNYRQLSTILSPTQEELARIEEETAKYELIQKNKNTEFLKECLLSCVTPSPDNNIVSLLYFTKHYRRICKKQHNVSRVSEKGIAIMLKNYLDINLFKDNGVEMFAIPHVLHNRETPYTCPRCEYKTFEMKDMHKHFYNKLSVCWSTKNKIDITENIKQCVLTHRVYETQF
jgi:hypothetical protein